MSRFEPVVTAGHLAVDAGGPEDVYVDDAIEDYICSTSPARPGTTSVSPSALAARPLALLKPARAAAVAAPRGEFAFPTTSRPWQAALAHRPVLRPEMWGTRLAAADIVGEILNRVPTPRIEQR